ncbi:hypothetical protein K474DRAFT_1705884 [Panus rudis PR-1116 ss-1]|nr:hypothetical protein K474DRAFT_1705884 [Panus rudis PR-1116 ss-1]
MGYRSRNYYVTCSVDGGPPKDTKKVRGRANAGGARPGPGRNKEYKADWNEEIILHVNSPTSSLNLTVFAVPKGKTYLDEALEIGTVAGSVEQFLHDSSTGDVERGLKGAGVENGPTLVFKLTSTTEGEVVERAAGALSHIAPEPLVASLLRRLDTFKDITGQVAELHDYAKIAHSLVFGAVKAQRDEKIRALLETITEMYKFVERADASTTYDAQKNVLNAITQQTLECVQFILNYARDQEYWDRLLKNTVCGVDQDIETYQTKFRDLRTRFNEATTVEIQLSVIRVLQKVDLSEEMAEMAVLDDLPYAENARYTSSKACLPGTRVAVLDEITDWILKMDDDRRVLLFTGPAGVGKSTVAHTIADRFDRLHRLGSSFFFDRNYRNVRGPGQLFSTIARNLADRDAQFRRELFEVIRDNKQLRKSQTPKDQFMNLIVRPAKKLTFAGPLVIVIDALDESGDYGDTSRLDIMHILSQHSQELPANFRILVTS